MIRSMDCLIGACLVDCNSDLRTKLHCWKMLMFHRWVVAVLMFKLMWWEMRTKEKLENVGHSASHTESKRKIYSKYFNNMALA